MRILQMHWAFPPIIGGVESHLAMLGPELVSLGCEVGLLTGAVEGVNSLYNYRGMLVKRTVLMDLNNLNPQKIAQQASEIKKEMEEFIDLFKPDLIHAHNMHYFSPKHADILREIKEARGIPLVLTAHNVWPDENLVWQEMNKRAGFWDGIIAVSQYIANELAMVGYDVGKIKVIHHGIDLKDFGVATIEDKALIATRYPEFAGRRVIFHPARMSLEKGCQISVKALDIIRKKFPEVLLVMAGTGKTVDWDSVQQQQVAQIIGLIDKNGLWDNVMVRFFAWDEMPFVYKAAEFSIYPSCFEEPFGLTMLESMASGKPMVVSKAGGMPEVIQDGVNGFLVPMFDELKLAEKCCLLLKDKSLCNRMGQTGRQMVMDKWTKAIMTNETLAVYKDVLLRNNKTAIS